MAKTLISVRLEEQTLKRIQWHCKGRPYLNPSLVINNVLANVFELVSKEQLFLIADSTDITYQGVEIRVGKKYNQ